MVSPVTGGVQQQLPIANTFQPGTAGSEQAKRPERESRADETRPSGTDTARAQASETRNYGKQEVSAAARSEDTGGVSSSSSRGTTLDITV